MGSSASASAKKKAPETDAAAAATDASARARARRSRRAARHDHGDELMNMDVDVDPDWSVPPSREPRLSTVASDQGAGHLGFAGTMVKDAGAAAGLTTLVEDEFGSGPKLPLVPGTWTPDEAGAS